jgi:hypothetical protein
VLLAGIIAIASTLLWAALGLAIGYAALFAVSRAGSDGTSREAGGGGWRTAGPVERHSHHDGTDL